jgi:hypothetical protein
MIKVGLVGEDPNDTLSIKNLLEKRYKRKVQFKSFTRTGTGYGLDSDKTKKNIPVEFEEKKCDFVIFIRDLDAFESQKSKVQKRINWFNELNVLVKNKGILLLNIWELEALILSDIEAFNKFFRINYKFNSDPMAQKEPKEILKKITSKSNKQFKESHCPELFKKLNIDKVEANCRCFKDFIQAFDKKLA